MRSCLLAPSLASLHDVMERLHGFLDRRGLVIAINLIKVDVIDLLSISVMMAARDSPCPFEPGRTRAETLVAIAVSR